MLDKICVCVLSAARTGSSLLDDQLSLNGFASCREILWEHEAAKYLNKDIIAENHVGYTTSLLAIYRGIIEDRMHEMRFVPPKEVRWIAPIGNPNGCCVKIHRNQLLHNVRTKCGWSIAKDIDVLRTIFPKHTKYVRLFRADKPARAVSHLFAKHTDQWTSYQCVKKTNEPLNTKKADEYLAWACSALYEWHDLNHELDMFTTTYETMERDFPKLAEFLGVELAWWNNTEHKKQISSEKSKFLDEYRKHVAANIDMEKLKWHIPFYNMESCVTPSDVLDDVVRIAVENQSTFNRFYAK